MARAMSNSAIDAYVSHLPGVVGAVFDTAVKISKKAEARLDMAKERTGASKIVVSRGKVDSYVSLVDPAAVSIEYGHRSSRSGRYVPGLYPVTGAARGF